MKTLIVLGLLAASAHASDLSEWKDRDKTYRQELAIESAEGKAAETKLRAEAQAIRAERIAKLGAAKVVTEGRVRDERRLEKIADADAEEAAARVEQAQADRTIATAPTAEAYARLFAARERIAAAGVRKAAANLEYEQFVYDGLAMLVEKQALDAEVLPEAKGELDAKAAQLHAAEKIHELAQSALPARR